MKDASGFEVREREDGVLVLDGPQQAKVYLSIGYAGIESEEDVVDLEDGEVLSDVIEQMNEHANVLLENSPVEYGWFVSEGE